MSYAGWRKLPEYFLRKTYWQFCKLDSSVQQLIFELAESQKFKCALCARNYGLVIEHDHEPEEGPGNRYTMFNIRGLVCQRCNQALNGYEMEQRGEYTNWEAGYPYLSSDKYEAYVDAYQRRVSPLIEAALEKRMGSANYWRRRLILQKFDDWHDEGGLPPSWLLRYREEQSRKIETPEDFFRVFAACTRFVIDQQKKDPNYQPPDDFLRLVGRVKSILDKVFADKDALTASEALPTH